MADLVSYSFQGTLTLPVAQPIYIPGTAQGVSFTVQPQQLEWIVEKVENWFDGRDEVILVDHGITDKRGMGYVILEWDGCEIDPLFLAILRDEDFVDDYTTYIRNLEEY